VEAILSPPPQSADLPVYDPRRLERICRRHKIQRLSVFGSYARGTDFGPDSDVDVLIALAAHTPKTFDRHMDIIFALEDLFGRSVDLCYESTLAECDRETRGLVEKDTKVLYEVR
jgi:predicted nucleotidyltransferase